MNPSSKKEGEIMIRVTYPQSEILINKDGMTIEPLLPSDAFAENEF